MQGKKRPKRLTSVYAKLDAWACEACILTIGLGTGTHILSPFHDGKGIGA
jgi:hypothetical protein